MGRRGAGDGTVRHRAGAPERRHQESDSADVQKGDTLLYLENLDNWCKVMTADGYTGYIQTEDISEPEAIEARTERKRFL